MSKYELKKMTLDGIEGEGYAYKRKTVFGKARQGIFFPENEEDLEELQDKEELTFEGTLYYRNRGRDKSFDVTITEVTPTRRGNRADFADTDNPDHI